MSTPISELSSQNDIKTVDSLTRQGSNALGKNEFLKLLVAQLAHQDPTKPQDSSEFVAQLAQFSALEQQQNTVSRLDTLLLGQATANQTAASTFIGKEVTFKGGTVNVAEGEGASASLSLKTAADKVTVSVADSTGRVVRTIQLGAHEAGEFSVEWDGRDENGNLAPAGTYSLSPAAFDAAKTSIPIGLTTHGTVTGVAFQDGVPFLKVDGALIKMSDVTSINTITPTADASTSALSQAFHVSAAGANAAYSNTKLLVPDLT